MKKPILAIVGPNKSLCSKKHADFASKAGYLAIELGYRVMTGGEKGVMSAAILGAKTNTSYASGDTIAMSPFHSAHDHSRKKPFESPADIVIYTGLGHARNFIMAHGDVVLAIGGGGGTLSEMALAWGFGRPIVAYKSEGWSGRLAGKKIDERRPNDRILGVSNIAELRRTLSLLKKKLA